MDFNKEYDKYIHKSFPKELVEKAINYKCSENDLFIASYPKCGTTWTQQIVYLLLNRGHPPETTILFSKAIPFLEFCAPEPQESSERSLRAFKTHLPFHLIPFNEKSKYIYCIRNPKDCCISFWYHEKDFPVLECNQFNQFFDVFMAGETGYGDYFDHMLGWYQQKHRNNVLIVNFEDLKIDFEAQVERIADFIDEDLSLRLKTDKEFKERVLKGSTFEFMKDTTNKQMKTFFDMSVDELKSNDNILDGFKNAFSGIKQTASVEIAPEVNFIRKGIIGDYATHLSAQQNEVMNKKIKEKVSKFPEIINNWKVFNVFQ